MSVKFIPGSEYTWLCKKCQKQIESIKQAFDLGLMEDTDDEEAPCNYVYDNRLFCGGHTCLERIDPNEVARDEEEENGI